MRENDPVSSPNHYHSPANIELVDVISHLNYCRSNAIKYIFRAGKKSKDTEVQDLQKALWCIQKELSLIDQCLKNNN